MTKFMQFFYVLFGLILLAPYQVCKSNLSLPKERRRINRELRRGKRVLHIPVELFSTLVAELLIKGWLVDVAVARANEKLRDVFVRSV